MDIFFFFGILISISCRVTLNWELLTDVPRKTDVKVPGARYSHSQVVLDDDLYVFGGYESANRMRGDFWKYSTTSITWEHIHPKRSSKGNTNSFNFCGYNGGIPGARSDSSMIATDDEIIMYGGYGYAMKCPDKHENCEDQLIEYNDDIDTGKCSYGYLSDIFIYDVKKNEWKLPKYINDQKKKKIEKLNFDIYYRTNYGDFEYDKNAKYPASRSNSLALFRATTNSMYIFGGRTYQEDTKSNLWYFDVTSHKWMLLSSPNEEGPEEGRPGYIPIPYGYLFREEIIIFSKNNWNHMWRFNIPARKWSRLINTQQQVSTKNMKKNELQDVYFSSLVFDGSRNLGILGFQKYLYTDKERDSPTHDYGIFFDFLFYDPSSHSPSMKWSDHSQSIDIHGSSNVNIKILKKSGRHEVLSHPSPRKYSSIAKIDDVLYLYGGQMADTVFGDLWILDLSEFLNSIFVDSNGNVHKCNSLPNTINSAEDKKKPINMCYCEDGYSGDFCEYFYCSGVQSDQRISCSGHGRCIGIDICYCDSEHSDGYSYYGRNCEYSVLSSSFSVKGIFFAVLKLLFYGILVGGIISYYFVGRYFFTWLEKEKKYSQEALMTILEHVDGVSEQWKAIKSSGLLNQGESRSVSVSEGSEEEGEGEGESGEDKELKYIRKKKKKIGKIEVFSLEISNLVKYVKTVMRFQKPEEEKTKSSRDKSPKKSPRKSEKTL